MTKTNNDSDGQATALTRANERQQHYSGKASDVVRALSLSGIALVWLFGAHRGHRALPETGLHEIRASEFFNPLCLFITCLTADLLQYFLAASLWASYHWSLDQLINNDPDPNEPPSPRLRIAYSLADRFRIVQLIESGYQSPVSLDKDQRRVRARNALASAKQPEGTNERAKHLLEPTPDPMSPPFLNAVTRCLFLAKFTFAIAAYLWLGVILVR